MGPSQAVQQPFGVTVFGSAVVRVEPDIASLTFAVARLAQQPADAFQQAREAVQAVHTYLMQAHMTDVASSHIRLSQSFRYIGGEQRFEGYMAKVSFTMLLRDLERLEEITSGIIAAGVNEIDAAKFQTARLREIRTEARQRAIAAAREKAGSLGVAVENVCSLASF